MLKFSTFFSMINIFQFCRSSLYHHSLCFLHFFIYINPQNSLLSSVQKQLTFKQWVLYYGCFQLIETQNQSNFYSPKIHPNIQLQMIKVINNQLYSDSELNLLIIYNEKNQVLILLYSPSKQDKKSFQFDIRQKKYLFCQFKTKYHKELIYYIQMHQRTPTLFDQIHKVTGRQFDRDQKQLLIQKKQDSCSDMYCILLDDLAIGLKDIFSLNNAFAKQAIANSQFAKYLGDTFLVAYLMVKCADFAGLKKNQFIAFLKIRSMRDAKPGNFFKLLLDVGQENRISQFKNSRQIEEFQETILNSKQWVSLKKAIQSLKSFANPNHSNNSQKQKEELQELEKLENILKQMKSSEIFDYLIQKELISAFRSKVSKEKNYTQQNFKKFKITLTKQLEQFGFRANEVQNVEIRSDQIKEKSYFYNLILNIRSKIHSIYFPDLLTLVLKNKNAKQILNEKDAVVILGPTGAGKSTLIQMMLGYQLIQIKKQGQLKTLVTKRSLEAKHSDFVAKASSKSVTRYVSTIKWEFPAQYGKKQIYLCDTPGFFDTQGLTVDASNGLSTIRTLTSANSIRFIFLLNHKAWGLRGQGFKAIGKLISKIFKSYDSDSVIYFLNCIKQQQLRQLPDIMRDIQDKLNSQQQGEHIFKAFVNHFRSLINQAKRKSKQKGITMTQSIKGINQLVIMDPFRPDLNQIYKKVLKDERKLENPQQNLNNMLGQGIKDALRSQSNKIKDIIKYYLKHDKLSPAEYYINLLKKISDQTQQANDAAQARKCLNDLQKQLKDKISEMMRAIDVILTKRVPSLKIDQSYLEQAKELQKKIFKIQVFYNSISISEKNQSKLDLKQKIAEKIADTSKYLLNKLQEQKNKQLFQTIFLFSKHFNQQLQDQFISTMKNIKSGLQQDIQKLVEREQFSQLDAKISSYNFNCDLFEIFKGYKECCDLAKRNQKWKRLLESKIQKYSSRLSKIKDNNSIPYEGRVPEILSDDIKWIQELLNKTRVDRYSQVPEILKINELHKNVRKQTESLGRSYIRQIQNFMRKSLNQKKKVNSVKKAKENVKKMIKIDQIKDLQNQLASSLAQLSQQISTQSHTITKQRSNISEDPNKLKQVHSALRHLKNLSLVCEIKQRKQCQEIISNTEQEIIKQLKSLEYKIYELSFNIASAQSIKDLSKFCNISLDKRGQGEDNDDDKIKIAHGQVKQIFQKKIQEILGSQVKNFIQERKQQVINSTLVEQWIPKMSKIIKFLDILNFQGADKQIKNMINQFIRFFKSTVTELKKNCLLQIKKIVQNIINYDKMLLQKQKLYEINKGRNILAKIFNNQAFKIVWDSQGIDIKEWKEQIYQALLSVEETMEGEFNQTKNKDMKKTYDFISFCSDLQILDSAKNQSSLKIKQKIKEWKQILQENLKAQDLKCNHSDIIQNGRINFFKFRSVYKFFKGFPQNSNQFKNLKNIIQRINNQFKEDEKKLRDFLNSPINRNISHNEGIDKLYQNIQDVMFISKEMQGIFKQGLNEGQTPKWKPLSVSQQTKRMILEQAKKIFNVFKSRIQKKIQEGGNGYDEAEALIDKFEYMERAFGNSEETKQYFQGQKKDGKSLVQQLIEELLTTKNNRQQKYLKADKIVIDADFSRQFNTFAQKQKQDIENKLQQQFNDQMQSLIQQGNNLREGQLRSRIRSFQKSTNELPEKIKKKIVNMIRQQQQRYLNLRTVDSEKAEKNFKFHNAYDLIKQEEKPFIIQTYKRKLEDHYETKLNIMKNQEFRSAEVINSLRQLFVANIQQKTLDQNQNFTKIYKIYLIEAMKMVKQKQINKNINEIAGLLGEKNRRGSEQKIQNNLRGEVQQLKLIWDFFEKHRSIFEQYLTNTKQDLEKLFHLTKEFYSKNLKDIGELRLSEIDGSPQNLQEWQFHVKRYMLITDVFRQRNQQKYLSEDIINQIKDNRQLLTRKKGEIQTKLKQILSFLDKFSFYSETIKNNSDSERMKIFETVQTYFDILIGFSGTRILMKPNLPQQISRLKDKLCQQIKSGIERNCEQVKRGYGSCEKQFSKQINVTLAIVKQASQKLPIIKLQAEKKKLIEVRIQQEQQKMYKAMEKNRKQIQNKKEMLNEALANRKKQSKRQIQRLQKDGKKVLQNEIKQLTDEYERNINEENEIDQEERLILKKNYENQVKQKKKQFKEQIQEKARQKIREQEKQYKAQKSQILRFLQEYTDCILILYKSNLELSFNQQKREADFNKKFRDDCKYFGTKIVNQVHDILKNKNSNYANIIIRQHEVFKNNQAIQWQAKVRGMGIDQILQELSLKQSIKRKLRQLFQSYSAQFSKWTKQFQNSPVDPTVYSLIQSIKEKARDLQEYYHKKGSSSNPEKLLASIFALWTIMKSDIQDGIVNFYYQPHSAQVVAIFLCLSLTQDKPKDLNSKMAQIGTGQGKSVVLAGISSYLALCGFEVNSVCYSGYLSSRDNKQFADLFQKLGISDKITYGTFNTVCQQLLNKKTKDSLGFRQQIKRLLIQNNKDDLFNKIKSFFSNLISQKPSINKSRKIMLIDQVDVFFDPLYFGSLYRPDVSLSSPDISQLLQYVWDEFKDDQTVTDKQIIKSPIFEKVIKNFQKLQEIFYDQARGMILGCRGTDHDYVVRSDLIQYKDQDGISSKINYGFQTLFAYLKQFDKKKITKNSLDNALKVSLIIAEFSYAMLPNYFRSILGVTGTYEGMSKFKKEYMKDQYSVKEYYVIPSVYGKNLKRLINPPKITQLAQHWDAIIQNIKQVHSTGRPVLVFFKSATQLDTFYNHPLFSQFQSKTTFLNETHPVTDRDNRIKKTCNKNNITLMTSSFGRGTDFYAFDQSIFRIGHGGLHVIQTFLSVQSSEQIQIQGRTARQGNPGTYSLIISKQELEKIKLNNLDLSKFQSQLKAAREKIEESQWHELMKRLNQSNQKHKKCVETYQNKKIEQHEIISYIQSLNNYQQIRQNISKTVIMVDATGSMNIVITKLLFILEQVVKACVQIPSKYPNVSSFQLQLFFFRNYDQPYQTLFQCTAFQSQPTNLVNFLTRMKAYGGIEREAAEIAYYHINKNPDVDQAIIISDIPANTPQETKKGRQQYLGQKYWSQKGVPLLSEKEEVKKIAQKQIPIHSFYINTFPGYNTAQYYGNVSQITKGVCQEFDVDAKNSSQILSEFIASRVLQKVAKDKYQAQEMISQYKKRYTL